MDNLFKDLSDNDVKLLAGAWLAMAETPKPDYDLLAQYCGYKNGGSASVMYGALKRKLLAKKAASASGNDATSTPPTKTPKKGSAKKRATIDDDNDELAADTPTAKKPKTEKKKKATKVKAEQVEEAVDGGANGGVGPELPEEMDAVKDYPFEF